MINNECNKSVWDAIRGSFQHALTESFYVVLSAFSTKTIDYMKNHLEQTKEINSNLNYFKYAGPIILLSNTYARLTEINNHAPDQKKVEGYESTIAQAMVNTILYKGTEILVSTAPVAALPMLGTFFACEFLLKGDNAPIDYAVEGISDMLHWAHVGDAIDYIL